jgi:hypothetical protein
MNWKRIPTRQEGRAERMRTAAVHKARPYGGVSMTPKRILALFVFLALIPWRCPFAQSDRATIVGTVKDAAAAVSDPACKGARDQRGHQRSRDHDHGQHRLLPGNGNLPIGSYTVSIAKAGFKTLERKGITLLISQVAEIDATLQVGGATESVVVTSAAPILQTEDSTLSSNLNGEAVSELPLNVQGSRNLSNFMFAYLPGVEGSDYSSHINGGMAMTKEVLIDGTSAVSQLGGYISESQPPMEAVQEFEADTVGHQRRCGALGRRRIQV